MSHAIPDRIREFANRNGLERASESRRVAFEQRGTMRLAPGGAWKPFTAEQWASEAEVAFCWHARVKMAPLLTAVVEDAYEGGHGTLDVKMWGAIPIAHEEGPELDRGEAQRYLAELPWNPTALIHNTHLRFEDGPEGSTRVWTREPACYVDLHFDDEGDIVRTFTETRSRGAAGISPWEGRFNEYGVIGSARVPLRGEVSWLLPDERFCYWRGELVSFRWA